MSDLENAAKLAVAKHVVSLIESGMTLGLGTGSTAALAIEELGIRIKQEALDVRAVPTSFASERLAESYGIPLSTLQSSPELDLAFDGADEVNPDMILIKGRGAAHTREKIVAAQSRRFVVLVDESKMVTKLGSKMPLPVEIVPMAITPVMRVLRDMGADPVLRMGLRKDGPVVSDQGFWILDARFDEITDPEGVNRVLLNTPGVLDHGLFISMATDILIGKSDGTVKVLTGNG